MSMQVESEIGIIASDWKLVDLGSVCEKPQYGFTASSAHIGNAKFLRITDINDLGVDWNSVPFCDCADKELEKYRLYSGDIVFARIGATTGKSYLIENPPKAVFASYLIRVRPKSEIASEYLNYFFRSDAYWRQVNANKSSNLKKGINGSILNTLLIPQPPLPEQRQIAKVLSKVQTAIEKQVRLITLMRELKSALLRKLFTEGLRGEKQKKTEMGLVPVSWEQLRLEKIGNVIYGIQAAVANNLQPIGMKILTNKNITLDGQIVLGDINYFELKSKRHFETVLKKGDILFNWRSGSKEHIGKTAYFDLDGEYTHSSFILRIRPNDNVNGRFLFWSLYFLRASGYFLQKHDISSVNATFNKSAVDALSICLPSKNEQEEIVSILDTVDTKISLLKQKRYIQEEFYHTLLNQLMTAQIRVHDLDYEGLENNHDREKADDQ
jgi:type I restriction enzyme, S subunit